MSEIQHAAWIAIFLSLSIPGVMIFFSSLLASTLRLNIHFEWSTNYVSFITSHRFSIGCHRNKMAVCSAFSLILMKIYNSIWRILVTFYYIFLYIMHLKSVLDFFKLQKKTYFILSVSNLYKDLLLIWRNPMNFSRNNIL